MNGFHVTNVRSIVALAIAQRGAALGREVMLSTQRSINFPDLASCPGIGASLEQDGRLVLHSNEQTFVFDINEHGVFLNGAKKPLGRKGWKTVLAKMQNPCTVIAQALHDAVVIEGRRRRKIVTAPGAPGTYREATAAAGRPAPPGGSTDAASAACH